MENTQTAKTESKEKEDPDGFDAVLIRTKLTSPQQVRDQVIFQMLRMALVKMELDEEERTLLHHQEKIFKLAQQQGF